MAIVSMVTLVETAVLLYLPENPNVFHRRMSLLAAEVLVKEFERVSKFGGDYPITSTGRMLSAIHGAEALIRQNLDQMGHSYLKASIRVDGAGAFSLKIDFKDDSYRPTHSSISIQ